MHSLLPTGDLAMKTFTTFSLTGMFAAFFLFTTQANATSVSVTAMDGFTSVEGATVTVRDSNGNEVATGTTERGPNGESPRVEFDLPEGDYTFDVEYTDASGTDKTGTENGNVGDSHTDVGVFVDPASMPNRHAANMQLRETGDSTGIFTQGSAVDASLMMAAASMNNAMASTPVEVMGPPPICH